MRHPFERLYTCLFVITFAILMLGPGAQAREPKDRISSIFHPLPEGFAMYLTFMGTGLYDWNSPHPEIPGCFQQLCVGEYFFDEILGLDDSEKRAWHNEALAFWSGRFGIDPYDPAWEGRVNAIPFFADPRNDIRAYSMAGTRIHREGWTVLDGGWLLIVTDPEGVELGGEYAGLHVGPNTVMGHGKYLIQARTRNGGFLADIALDYQARGPISFVQGFPWVGNCEVFRTTIDGETIDWGVGQAQPSQVVIPMPANEVKLSYRNIITFGAGGGFGEPFE